jgi:hypothetical protein
MCVGRYFPKENNVNISGATETNKIIVAADIIGCLYIAANIIVI